MRAAARKTGGSEHLTLVIAGQVFGAGKSQMGKRVVARAKQRDVKDKLIREFPNLQGYLAMALRLAIVDAAIKGDEPWAALIRGVDWKKVPKTCVDIVERFFKCTQRAIFVRWGIY